MTGETRAESGARCGSGRLAALLGLAGGTLALLAAPGPGRSTITAPFLQLTELTTEATPDGTLLRAEGSFPFEGAIDEAYPFQLFVRTLEKQTNRYVSFSPVWGPLGGDDPFVKKGLDEKNAYEIFRVSHPLTDARLIAVSPRAIEVQLPPDFPLGEAEAQIFVLYEGDPLFSNPLPFLVEAHAEDAGDDCRGKVAEAVFRYRGGDCTESANTQEKDRCEGRDPGAGPVSVRITKDADKVMAVPADGIRPGDLVSFTRVEGELGGDTEFDVVGPAGTQSLEIHTSCSQPFDVGDVFGSFELVSLATTEDGL